MNILVNFNWRPKHSVINDWRFLDDRDKMFGFLEICLNVNK
jgi:hypothetical protein